MIDPFGRHISYLRVSVTDRCDFRCVYCMAEDMTFLPKAELLTLEEMDRLCSAFVQKGVRKLRLTGGEPLVRKNLMWLIQRLSRHLDSGALDELTLTTNGTQLERFAPLLRDAGMIVTEIIESCSVEERTDPGLIQEKVRVDLQRVFRKRSGRRPLVVPVIMEI